MTTATTTRTRFFVVRRRCTAAEWAVIMYLWAAINHFRSPDCGYRPLAYGLKSYRFLAVPHWSCAPRRRRFFLFSSGQSLGIFMREINGPNSARCPLFRAARYEPNSVFRKYVYSRCDCSNAIVNLLSNYSQMHEIALPISLTSNTFGI